VPAGSREVTVAFNFISECTEKHVYSYKHSDCQRALPRSSHFNPTKRITDTYLTEGLLGGSESRLDVVITKTNKSYFKLMFPQYGTTDIISSLCGIESSSIQIQNKDYSLSANYKSVDSNIL
jgi:hypothetical protein